MPTFIEQENDPSYITMNRVSIDDIDNEPRVSSIQKHLTEPLGLTDMAMNYYELEPGESFSGGLHTHTGQEEIFYILEGEATFETKEDNFTVTAGEVIRFAPGEYQEGKNESEARVTALALGAPQEMGETRSALPCQECGADYHIADVHASGVTLTCPDCENEFTV